MLYVLGILFLGLLVAAIWQGMHLYSKLDPMVGFYVGPRTARSFEVMYVKELGYYEFERCFGWDQLWPHVWATAGVYLVTAFWCWAFWLYDWNWVRLLTEAPGGVVLCVFAAAAIPPILWGANFFARFQKLAEEVIYGKMATIAIAVMLPLWWPAIAVWLPGYGILRLWQRICRIGPYALPKWKRAPTLAQEKS